jgi:hypothetical protein
MDAADFAARSKGEMIRVRVDSAAHDAILRAAADIVGGDVRPIGGRKGQLPAPIAKQGCRRRLR